MDFFDMFVFNNVKSNIKNTFYQPTKAKSNTKMLSLYRLSPYRKPRLAEGGQTYIMIKGVFVRFGFDLLELRKHSTVRQRQSNGNASLGVLYTALIGF